MKPLTSLLKIIDSVLEALFPVRTDAAVVHKLSAEALQCIMSVRMVGGVEALLPFSHQSVRACIHEVKYHDNEKAARLLAHSLETYLHTNSADILIPIPLSQQRRKQRGYNQVERIVKHIPLETLGCTLETNILYRVRDTAPQTSLTRVERLQNVADAFGIRDISTATHTIRDRHVIIIDDVTTTGATLKAARAALAALSPASITLLALAH